VDTLDLYFDLNLVQSQKVVLTPQLKQAYEILKMTSQELFEYVEEQLEVNPALEILDTISTDFDDNYLEMENLLNWQVDLFSEEIFNERYEDDDEIDNFKTTTDLDEKLTLKEHLLFQLHTSDLSDGQICIGEYIIDNIDENGYLTIGLTEVAEFFNVSTIKVKKVLEHIQTFDPPGICARSLKECIYLQLKQANKCDRDILKIIEGYLDELAEERFDLISRETGLPIHKVEEVSKFLRTLEPKPGREYYDSNSVRYMIPDIVVKNISGKLEVTINEDSIPLLNINEYYRKILDADVGNEVKRFIINRIESATWLLKCIEQRKVILKKAADFLLQSQMEFFDKGKNYLKPVKLNVISDELGVHESIAEVILNGKYIQCSWGVFELKYFIE
jgi:RNA polymerase sigma-54 factor